MPRARAPYKVRRRMRLAPLTTLRLGGPAERLVEADTEDELIDGRARATRRCVLAGGSNVVIADEGVPGTVVLVRTRGIERDGDLLVVQAGEPWDDVVAHCVDGGPAGLRVPVRHPRLDRRDADPERRRLRAGRVGDGRVGARLRPRDATRVDTLDAAACGFELPPQRLQVPRPLDGARGRVPAARVRALRPAPLRRAGARRSTSRSAASAPLADVREAVLGLRRGKGMVIDPGDPDSRQRRLVLHQPDPRPTRSGRALPGDPPALARSPTGGSRPPPRG